MGGVTTGFDANDELGLLAIADESGNVGVYHTQTGEQLRLMKATSEHRSENPKRGDPNPEAVQCLKWIQQEGGEDVLIGGQGNKVVEWAWQAESAFD